MPAKSLKEVRTKLDVLCTRDRARSEQEVEHCVNQWELGNGMRYALKEFQRELVGCKNGNIYGID